MPPVLSEAAATVRSGNVTAAAAILAGVVAAGAAIGGTYLGSLLARGQVHDQFIAERRQETYAQYVTDVEELSRRSVAFFDAEDDSAAEAMMAGLDEVGLGYNQVRLIAGQGIQDEARQLADDVEERVMSQLREYCDGAGPDVRVCVSVLESDAVVLSDYEQAMDVYEDDKNALVVSMRIELDVPA